MSDNSAIEQMQKVQQILDEYEKNNALPNMQVPAEESEINLYLSMNRNQLESLSPTDCADINVRLRQYSFHLQRLLNAERSRITWCNAAIERYVCDKLEQFNNSYFKHETKIRIIAKTDEYLRKLTIIKDKAEQRISRLDSLSMSIQGLASAFLAAKKNKEYNS